MKDGVREEEVIYEIERIAQMEEIRWRKNAPWLNEEYRYTPFVLFNLSIVISQNICRDYCFAS